MSSEERSGGSEVCLPGLKLRVRNCSGGGVSIKAGRTRLGQKRLGFGGSAHLLRCLIPQVSILNKYSEAIRGNLTKIMRLKIVALVTIEVHARDVLEKLYKSGLMDVSSFDWLSQLRFYWEKVQRASFPFSYPKPDTDALMKFMFSKE